MIVVATERCVVCKRNFPLTGTVCPPCSLHYYQDEDQDQDQDEVFLSEKQFLRPSSSSADAPTRARPGSSEGDDGPEIERLEQARLLGQLQPVDVKLGDLPPHAGPVMRSIAEHMRTRMGLRRAVGDDRPLPYATSVAVKEGFARDKPTASNAIRALVRAGVIEHVGQLKPRPGLAGTKLYAPPGEDHGDGEAT